jgi:hypothetical protein
VFLPTAGSEEIYGKMQIPLEASPPVQEEQRGQVCALPLGGKCGGEGFAAAFINIVFGGEKNPGSMPPFSLVPPRTVTGSFPKLHL